MMLRLDPPIPLRHADGRKMLAHVLIDYGAECDLLWVCIMDVGGEIWCWPNDCVRGQNNTSMGRKEDA